MNKFNALLTFIGLLQLGQLHALEVKADPERLNKLLELTNREIKTIHDNIYTGPELKHRLFELYTEKIKLMRERETNLMLKEDPQTVLKRGKESYYANSLEQYQLAQKYGLSVINKYPTYKKIAEIYYSLAINSRDFGTNRETEGFLKLAIKFSMENSKTLHNAKTSLAEYYYNEKKYAEAVAFYEEILKDQTDEWYGKHLYNAAWCHLKERHFPRALTLMKEAFETTKEPKYVSLKEQILNAIGIFYVQADRTPEAITFYEKNTKPSATYLLALAKSSMDKNNFSITDEVLKAALRDTQNRKDQNGELKVRLTQLDIYRESKKDELFFLTSQNIVDLYKKNNKLNPDDLLAGMNKIKEVAGFMQVNLVKDKTKDELQYNKEDYKKIMKYFDMLTVLDKPHKNQYRYYQGETALSVRDQHLAMKYYIRSIMTGKKMKDKGEFTRKSLESILTIIDDVEMPTKLKNEYIIYTYKNFLAIYPTSDKSQALYQKLFNKYFELKKTKKATNILLVYKENYPSDEKIHREMLTQLLDKYIKVKNTDMLAAWINLIEKGYLNFNSDYVQNSIAVLGDLLFDRYHNLEKKGKIKEAMNGYEEIYESKKYPNKIKAEAAYAMAAALLDLNNAKKSYKWLNRSLEIYDPKDLAKVTGSLYVMTKNFRLLQNFETSQSIASMISKKYCNEKIEQKDNFYELLMTTSAMEKLESKSLLTLENEFINCKLSERTIKKTRSEILEMMIENDSFINAKDYFLSVEHSENSHKLMSKYLRFKFFQNPDLFSRDILEISKLNPDLKLAEMLNHFEQIKLYREKLIGFKVEFSVSEKFDADRYNSELEQYLSMVNDFQKEAVILSKESNPEEIILMRDILARPLIVLKKAILEYSPRGVDNKYLAGFREGMRQVSESLQSKILQFDREKLAFLEKNNYFFQIQKHVKFEKANRENALSDENLLDNHQAIIFANTLDLSSNDTVSLVQSDR